MLGEGEGGRQQTHEASDQRDMPAGGPGMWWSSCTATDEISPVTGGLLQLVGQGQEILKDSCPYRSASFIFRGKKKM